MPTTFIQEVALFKPLLLHHSVGDVPDAFISKGRGPLFIVISTKRSAWRDLQISQVGRVLFSFFIAYYPKELAFNRIGFVYGVTSV